MSESVHLRNVYSKRVYFIYISIFRTACRYIPIELTEAPFVGPQAPSSGKSYTYLLLDQSKLDV